MFPGRSLNPYPVLLLILLLATGCQYIGTPPPARENRKPNVFIANVPLSSVNLADTIWSGGVIDSILENYDSVVIAATYSASPRIHWYGIDTDGRVEAYEYAVAPTDSLNPHPAGLVVVNTPVGVDPRRFVINRASADSLDWIYVEAPSAVVGLYADIDTTVAVDQFLFVRAIDNLGLRSDIRYARYSRRNHPPDTYLRFDTTEVIRIRAAPDITRPRKYYSLRQPTETYPGITIGWYGSDSLDYPRTQPPLAYNWTLYGPFDSKAHAVADSTMIVRTSDNLATLRVEATDLERHTFFDLRSGWYLFEVRTRDDAFVFDPTPAKARFEVVEPRFDKPYMLMDASNYWQDPGSVNFPGRAEGQLPALTPDTIHSFYYRLFADQGWEFGPVDVWTRSHLTDRHAPLNLLPDRDTLARYKALIVFDDDLYTPLDLDAPGSRQFTPALSEYMNIGGRVILIGRNLFGGSVANWSSHSPPQEVTFSAADFPFRYFGVTRMYFPGYDTRSSGSGSSDWGDPTDFVGTEPIDPDYPPVAADTTTPYPYWIPPLADQEPMDTSTAYGRTSLLTGLHPDGTPRWRFAPHVNWIGIDRNRGATGFYLFQSAYPNTSPSQGRICGARFEFYDRILDRPTYRTTVVTFELWTMEHTDRTRRLAKQLLTYILD